MALAQRRPLALARVSAIDARDADGSSPGASQTPLVQGAASDLRATVATPVVTVVAGGAHAARSVRRLYQRARLDAAGRWVLDLPLDDARAVLDMFDEEAASEGASSWWGPR